MNDRPDEEQPAAAAPSRKQQVAAARKARLEASLRQNLSRRKAQTRGRNALTDDEDMAVDD